MQLVRKIPDLSGFRCLLEEQIFIFQKLLKEKSSKAQSKNLNNPGASVYSGPKQLPQLSFDFSWASGNLINSRLPNQPFAQEHHQQRIPHWLAKHSLHTSVYLYFSFLLSNICQVT